MVGYDRDAVALRAGRVGRSCGKRRGQTYRRCNGERLR
jgi:hypothetical protein